MPLITQDLNGQWQFKQYPLSARKMQDLDTNDWLQTKVPSSIFTSLIEAGQISTEELYKNPENFSDISEKPWIYRKFFDVTPELLNCDRMELIFDSLDTVATIWFNDKLVTRTNNMFTQFRFDVTELIKPLNNCLLVKFEPPVEYAKKLMEHHNLFSKAAFNNPYRVYIRKAQFQFGWDFCPPLPGCGIVEAVRLEGLKKAGIKHIHIRTVDCTSEFADIKIAISLDTLVKAPLLCKLNFRSFDHISEHTLSFKPGEDSNSVLVRIENPSLWSPAGYGPQNLYSLEIQLLSGNDILDIIKTRFGIRNSKVLRRTDLENDTFMFEVNGRKIYVKGANWVPPSIFPGSVSSDDYRQLLNSAKNANINMLRVWGGGYYETELFYSICDELGIMVWQDFMFACAYYPEGQWFTEQVKKEAAHVIKRLRNHPSLMLWCGNSEIDWLHSTGKLGTIKKFYGKSIYHHLLPQLVKDLDPDTAYIPTTPLSGKENFKTDDNLLTTHQWKIWSGYEPVRKYFSSEENIPPFVTEFGLQSMPAFKTTQKFCNNEQLRITNRNIEKHNYQVDGGGRLHRYISDLFEPAADLERFIYLSQLTQARAVKAYVEYLRAHNSLNNGVMFWQFNDPCPAITWSAIDSEKEPKALYYYAKRFYNPLLVTAIAAPESQTASQPPIDYISAIVINDKDQPLTATLNCDLIDLYGKTLDRITMPVSLTPFCSSNRLKLPKAIASPSEPQKCCLRLTLERDNFRIAENLLFYLPDKYMDWPKPVFDICAEKLTDTQWELKIRTNTVAKDVLLSSDINVRFSDNFFDMYPLELITIKADCDPGIESLESFLRIQSVSQ